MLNNYVNQTVSKLLDHVDEKQIQWAWAVIEEAREVLPDMDHWTTSAGPGDLRMGIRTLDAQKGKPLFSLYFYKGNLYFSVRKIYRDQVEHWEISCGDTPDRQNLHNWFLSKIEQLEKIFTELPTMGNKHVPADYQQEDGDTTDWVEDSMPPCS